MMQRILRGVAPSQVSTGDIYRGARPFIAIQVVVLVLVWAVPQFVTVLTEHSGPVSVPGLSGDPTRIDIQVEPIEMPPPSQ